MKKMFRKAMTVLGSAALVGATVGVAAAASYPQPFTSNTAIVVGANAAPSDSIAASSIAANLDAASAGSSLGGSTTVTGGDSYKFEKTSTKFHLGDTITSVISSSLDEDDLPQLLNDGVFVDDDNDEFDFTQEITMPATQLVMFEDSDYKADEPTIGFHYTAGADVLDYTLEFSEEPDIADLATSDLTFMGRQYYVLSAAYNELTLLDSASDTVVAEGETITVSAGGKTYTVSISFIGSTSVKLNINGEITNNLEATETYKLSDGSYVGIKEVLYSSKDTGISKVEFSIGNGKLVLTSGSEVELNEDNVDSLTATIVNNSAKLTSVSLDWNADDDIFVTADSSVEMPGFGAVKLTFGGLNYPAEESIKVGMKGDDVLILDDFPLKDSTEDISLLYTDGTTYTAIGGAATDNGLLTGWAAGTTSITFDGDTHDYFVASWTDGRDAESYLMRATNFKVDNTINKTTFQYKNNGVWTDAKTDRKDTDTFTVGNVDLTVGAINKVDKTVVISNNSADTSFNTLYSEEGMKVFLPFDSLTATTTGVINLTAAPSAYNITMIEEDKDGDTAAGATITVAVGLNTQSPKEPTVTNVFSSASLAGEQEVGSTDVFRDFVYSALATEILHDKGPDMKDLELIYHGDEVAADVYITSPEATVSSDGGDAGVMTVMDNAVSTVAGKNLIVVGGSAINSVAAELLGGAYRTEEFTSMTGVGAGEFLIQSFNRAGTTALLVAGYNAADTTKAATYLINNNVDTSVGMKMKGTSATQATVVTA